MSVVPWFAPTLNALLEGQDLDPVRMCAVMHAVLGGDCADAELAALLIALRSKGETADELAAAAVVLREYMTPLVSGRDDLLDTCGTGGDGAGTFNISTATALVVAAVGVPVVKHGNRAVSSRSGSADVLSVLGVTVGADPATGRRWTDSKQLKGGPGRIGQRTDQVEECPHSQTPADVAHPSQDRMEARCQTEGHADPVQAAPPRRRVRADRDAKDAENVGAAAAAGHCAVAVLDHRHTHGSDHQGRGRADVERAGTVAPRAAGIQQVIAPRGQRRHVFAQHDRCRREFIRRLSLGTQGDQQSGQFRVGAVSPSEEQRGITAHIRNSDRDPGLPARR